MPPKNIKCLICLLSHNSYTSLITNCEIVGDLILIGELNVTFLKFRHIHVDLKYIS